MARVVSLHNRQHQEVNDMMEAWREDIPTRVAAITYRADGAYIFECTSGFSRTEVIGALEMLKHGMLDAT